MSQKITDCHGVWLFPGYSLATFDEKRLLLAHPLLSRFWFQFSLTPENY